MQRDWDNFYRRLETARSVIGKSLERTAEEKKMVLRERAKLLAQKQVERAGEGTHIDVLEFRLAHEHYGIDTSSVGEVWTMKDLTPLPCTPSFLSGIINVRGRIIPVVDLKRFFNLPEKGLTDLNKVVILKAEKVELGILADEITGTRSLGPTEIRPPFSGALEIHSAYLKGLTRDRLIILDAEKILFDKQLIIHEEVQT